MKNYKKGECRIFSFWRANTIDRTLPRFSPNLYQLDIEKRTVEHMADFTKVISALFSDEKDANNFTFGSQLGLVSSFSIPDEDTVYFQFVQITMTKTKEKRRAKKTKMILLKYDTRERTVIAKKMIPISGG